MFARTYDLRLAALAVFALTAAASFGALAAAPASQPAASAADRRAQAAKNYGRLPLSFEANQGQADPGVEFLSRGDGYSLFLTDSGAILALTKVGRLVHQGDGLAGADARALPAAKSGKIGLVGMKLAGASRPVQARGEDQLPGKANYFIGNDPARWRRNVPTYAKVRFSGVYPGVDLVYYGNQRQLEYDFVIAPGGSPAPIRLQFSGTRRLRLDGEGNLILTAAEGSLSFHRPVVYQELNSRRQAVDGRFTLLANRSVGFSLGSYDHSRPLIIDPVLVYSTYIGGSSGLGVLSGDSANAITLDDDGHAFITGFTGSPNFPVTSGAYQKTSTATETNQYIPFVAELSQSGGRLLFSTYVGGTTADQAYGIAVDKAGNVYIAGSALSSDFPVTTGAFQTKNHGAAIEAPNAFVTELNWEGSDLIYSTYVGGSGASKFLGDAATGLALDSAGNVYIAGTAYSRNFPTTGGAFQRTNKATGADTANAFVAKLNPDGTRLIYSTYLGGMGSVGASGVAIDAAGNAFVAGETQKDFPVTGGAFQTRFKADSSGYNAFITKLNPDGNGLVYSTYIGGSGSVTVAGPALDSSDDAFITGYAYGNDFPVTAGAFQSTNHAAAKNGPNAFVTKLNPEGSRLVYSTYLGGSLDDQAAAIAVDPTGHAIVGGYSASTDFPVTDLALQIQNKTPSAHPGYNGFLTRLDFSGGGLIYSTLEGGDGYYFAAYGTLGDGVQAVAVDGDDDVYSAGKVFSTNFPATIGAFQRVNRGAANHNFNAFVAKMHLDASTQIGTTTTLSSSANPAAEGASVELTAKVVDAIGRDAINGVVTFTVGGKTVATVDVSTAGVATFSTSTLAVGANAVAANYADPRPYYASSAASLTETITGP